MIASTPLPSFGPVVGPLALAPLPPLPPLVDCCSGIGVLTCPRSLSFSWVWFAGVVLSRVRSANDLLLFAMRKAVMESGVGVTGVDYTSQATSSAKHTQQGDEVMQARASSFYFIVFVLAVRHAILRLLVSRWIPTKAEVV